MSKKKRHHKTGIRPQSRKTAPRRRVALAAAVVVFLVAVVTFLATGGILAQRSKSPQKKASTVAPQDALSPSKEYVYVDGKVVAIEEGTGSGGCTYTLNPTSNPNVPVSGSGTTPYQITITTTCAWTATSSVSWITFPSGSSGSGNGTLNYLVAASTNPSSQTGIITIGNVQFQVTQAGTSCSYSLSSTGQTFQASGGSGSFGVTAVSGCAWTAISSASWITITAPTGGSGSGNGTVTYTVAPNTSQLALNGTITLANQVYTITEAGACTYSISPTSQSFAASGGSSTVNVTTGSACAITATTAANWITLTSESGTSCGSGVCGPTGAVNYSVSGNPTTQSRSGTIQIGDQTFTVTQSAGCALTFSPASGALDFPAAGSTQSITVTTSGTGCSWSAAAVDSWITVNSPGSGSGNGTISLTVGQNPNTTSRSGSISITNNGFVYTYTVTQDASICGYQVTPTSINAAQAGGNFNNGVNVSTGSGCTWTASSNVSWIIITGANGGSISFTGSNPVSFSVGANTTTSTRTGTMSIAGTTVTVTQPGTCGYTLSSSSQSFTASGGTGSFNVNTQSGCSWTATSNASWVTITSGSSGTGTGTVNYSVAVNTGSQRTGTITAGGQTFTVTEAAPCSYSLTPTSQSFSSSGGSNSVSVTAGAGCAWTATSNNSWLTITSGASGSGNGTVNYSAAANTGTSAVTGTMTIGGQPFTVTVAGVSCSYSISPTSQNFTASGGTSSFTVTTNLGGCTWTASPSASWITITSPSGGNGTGGGTVNYSVAANTGSSRTGTITTGAQILTITEAGSSNCPSVTTFSGTGVAGYLEGNPSTAKWSDPSSIATAKEPAGANAVFIADTDNSRIRMVYIDGANAGQSVLIAGNGTAGYSPPGSNATTVSINAPRGLAVVTNTSGIVTAIYFADTGNNMIRKLTPPSGGSGPWAIADFSGSGIAGYTDGAPGSAQFNAPQGVAVASNGTVYVADANNDVIRSLDTSGNASTFLNGTNSGLRTPVGVAVSKNTGIVYVSDQGVHSIFSINSGGTLTQIAGSGAAGFADATGTAAKFNSPYQLTWTTTTGDGEVLYIADRLNQRLRKLVISTKVVTTWAGNGTAGFADSSCSSAEFNSPRGVGVGPSGEVYVADSANNRIRKVQ